MVLTRSRRSRISRLSLVLAAVLLTAPVPLTVSPPTVLASATPDLLAASVATPKPLVGLSPAPVAVPAATPVALVVSDAPDNPGPFAVLPGGDLPTDTRCAARVVRTPENRSANSAANRVKGSAGSATYRNWGTNPTAVGYLKRVSGNYTGTTDEIIQWAACKWGFDPEAVRAQVMIESSWRQGAQAGFLPNAQSCSDPKLRRPVTATTIPALPPTTGAPLVSVVETPAVPTESTTTTTGVSPTTNAPAYECPTAFGLLQLRSDYQPGTYPMSARSTAFNLDYGLAMKRACYEGASWLGSQTRGDAWGCVGVHYSGKWRDPAATDYIARVQWAQEQKVWRTFR